MESWSWTFDSKAKMGSLDWESKSPFIVENNVVFPHNAISIENQGFGETCFPQIMGNSLLSPIMGATYNEFLEQHESSSELSSFVVESNGIFDLIKNVPLKEKRIAGFNSPSPFCKVHGCNLSLVSSKDYHKRHKVCELHSKTAKVIVNGVEQRFCQQCSRFHLLSEFDEGKRSCRKRLADHNERRRKPHLHHHRKLLPPYNPKGSKFKGSTRTKTKSSSMSSVTDVQHHPSLYAQASSSVLFPFPYKDGTGGDQVDFITSDSTCALSLLSSQSQGSPSFHSTRNPTTSWLHPLSQNAHRTKGELNSMNSLVGSEYMNSENRLWCDEGSTIDLLQLSTQLERVELHEEIVCTKPQK